MTEKGLDEESIRVRMSSKLKRDMIKAAANRDRDYSWLVRTLLREEIERQKAAGKKF